MAGGWCGGSGNKVAMVAQKSWTARSRLLCWLLFLLLLLPSTVLHTPTYLGNKHLRRGGGQ